MSDQETNEDLIWQEIILLREENIKLREIAQEFCDRRDKGEIRSTYTYKKFKDVLNRYSWRKENDGNKMQSL